MSRKLKSPVHLVNFFNEIKEIWKIEISELCECISGYNFSYLCNCLSGNIFTSEKEKKNSCLIRMKKKCFVRLQVTRINICQIASLFPLFWVLKVKNCCGFLSSHLSWHEGLITIWSVCYNLLNIVFGYPSRDKELDIWCR